MRVRKMRWYVMGCDERNGIGYKELGNRIERQVVG